MTATIQIQMCKCFPRRANKRRLKLQPSNRPKEKQSLQVIPTIQMTLTNQRSLRPRLFKRKSLLLLQNKDQGSKARLRKKAKIVMMMKICHQIQTSQNLKVRLFLRRNHLQHQSKALESRAK